MGAVVCCIWSLCKFGWLVGWSLTILSIQVAISHDECRRGARLLSLGHSSLRHVVSMTPDLWLPSQPQGITTPWLVPNYIGRWWQHMCALCKQLPKVVTWKQNGQDSNTQSFELQGYTLTINYTTMPLITPLGIFSIDTLTKELKIKNKTVTP